MSNFNIVLMGFFIGIIGTGAGGAITYLYRKPTNRFLSTILGFAGGIMLSVVTFDLLPHAFEIGGLNVGMLGLIAGVLIVVFFEDILPEKGKRNNYLKEGIIMGFAIAIHNFPEGLAVGSGFMSSSSFGLSIALVIALHDIPEGIAMSTPLSIGGVTPFKNMLYAILAGIPTGLGTIAGVYMGEVSPFFIALNLGIAGGAMLYVTCGEMIPESRDLYRGRISVFGMIAGIISGIIITRVL
ncbi:ZIP family metal transporter [Thermoanaerobacterium thermosaccharolyticum]|uniref:Putative divalent heavy-metal cations transporter n=1 Tax=Thermoanaerobacterium thermosaccharolyticum M0795 TaxID=698948 RepID=L0IKU3_THETR|nr:ZIP family metal transporter [Thermoanaerobacterium thermosaccharolyticum]AGB20150.1 putative divalent heavy-metal cations transporter [Thermoanaerobacterium thermosaccharolyticum M0795]